MTYRVDIDELREDFGRYLCGAFHRARQSGKPPDQAGWEAADCLLRILLTHLEAMDDDEEEEG